MEVQHSVEARDLTRLILSIFRTNGRLLRAGDKLIKDLTMTSARWQVFGAIEEGPKTIAQIAREYELSRQGVLWVVQSMINQDLLKLIDNPGHRRAKLVDFTTLGREVFDQITLRQRIWSNKLAESFTSAELEQANIILTRLGNLVAT